MNIGICMLKTYKTYNPIVEFLKFKFNNKLLGGVMLLNECLDPRHVFTFAFSTNFFFVFPQHMNSNITWLHCTRDKMHCSRTIHESHGTIHIIKNYFVTVFSVFSFSKNKLYPNGS